MKANEEVLKAHGWKSHGLGEWSHPTSGHRITVNERRGTFSHAGQGGREFGEGKLSDLHQHLKKSGQDSHLLHGMGKPGGHAGYGKNS